MRQLPKKSVSPMSIKAGNYVLREETKEALVRFRGSRDDYNQLSEVDLLVRLHEDFYPDLTEEEFLSRVSLIRNATHASALKVNTEKLRSFTALAALVLLFAAIAWYIVPRPTPLTAEPSNKSAPNDERAAEDFTTNQGETACVVNGDALDLTPEECAKWREIVSEMEPAEEPPTDSTTDSGDAPPSDQAPPELPPRDIIADELAAELPICPADGVTDWDQCTGELSFPDNRTYKGQWINDQINGDGIMTYPDGGEYRGTFKDGLRHGNGAMIYPNGRKQVGRWENDNFIE